MVANRPPAYVPKFQADATYAAPMVQNTWYTILPTTKNCRIYQIMFAQATADETIEIELTVDGIVFPHTGANATANTWYSVDFHTGVVAANTIFFISIVAYKAFLLEGRNVQLRMRKTTAAGANDIYVRVIYAKW